MTKQKEGGKEGGREEELLNNYIRIMKGEIYRI